MGRGWRQPQAQGLYMGLPSAHPRLSPGLGRNVSRGKSPPPPFPCARTHTHVRAQAYSSGFLDSVGSAVLRRVNRKVTVGSGCRSNFCSEEGGFGREGAVVMAQHHRGDGW